MREQFDFTKVLGISEAFFGIQVLEQKWIYCQKTLYIYFGDFEKDFDTGKHIE